MTTFKKNPTRIAVLLALWLFIFTYTSQACAARYSRSNARDVIAKTSYIIDEAYDMASYYDYWSGNALSKAVYYNDYAQQLYRRRSYHSAIDYSLRARQYAVRVIDNCDDYWDYFFFTYYGWSWGHGYNSSYVAGYNSGYADGYYAARYRNYCNRYDHYDSRHNPHGQNHHNSPSDYHHNSGQNQGNVNTGRGENSNTTSNAGSTRPGVRNNSVENPLYNDISNEQYFDKNELKLISSAAKDEVLERDFVKANPGKTFDDTKLSTDKTALETNKISAANFTQPAKTSANISLAKPAAVTTSDQVKKESMKKPVEPIKQPVITEKPMPIEVEKPAVSQPAKQVKPIEATPVEVSKPAVSQPAKQVKPKETTTSGASKPAVSQPAKQVKPATKPAAKTPTKEVKQVEKQAKPAAKKPVETSKKEVKQTEKPVKAASKSARAR